MKTDADKQNNSRPAGAFLERVWLAVIVAMLVLLTIFARSHLEKNAGGFAIDLYFPFISTNQLAFLNPPPSDPVRENGRYLYTAACAPCHQADGGGTLGQYPPIAGSEWVQANGAGRLIRIVLNGMQGEVEVAGAKYNNVMVPFKDLLSDSQISAILTFIRSEWGNGAGAVFPDNVKSVREKTASRTEQWTAQELLEISEYE